MTLTKKLMVAGGFLGLALAALGLIRIMSGHDDPITVENPEVLVHFGFFSHRMVVTRDPADDKVVQLSRDITSLNSISVLFRNRQSASDFNLAEPITLEDASGGRIVISTAAGSPYKQFVVTLSKQFGACRYDSLFNNRCFAADGDLRLKTIKYVTSQGVPKHRCLDDGGDVSSGQPCVVSAKGPKAGLSFTMNKH